MTTAYLTAGLPVQDTSAPEPSAATAYLTAGLPADDLTHTGYAWYAGATVAAIDYDNPVALVPAGVASTPIVLADGLWWLSAKSIAATSFNESAASDPIRVEISGGAILAPRPNGIASETVRLTPAAAGKVHLEFRYDSAGELAAATSVEVARRVSGAYDWAAPAQTIAISGTTNYDADLDDTYTGGELVDLAIRVKTAAGRTSTPTSCGVAVADATSPSAPELLTVTQEEDPA